MHLGVKKMSTVQKIYMEETIKFICPECRNIWIVEGYGMFSKTDITVLKDDLDCPKCGTQGMTMKGYENWCKKYDKTIAE